MADTESHVDDTTVLGEDDLRDVRSAVADLAAKWKDLGISLGICSSDVDAIFSANPYSPSDCLREMLAIWLKQNYNVERFGKPTWRRLVEAVEDKVGGNNSALSQKIATEHPGAPDEHHRKLEQSHHSRPHPEKGLTDHLDIPQYIRVMVSNYQPLQMVFAMSESECHARGMKIDGRFSPTVNIVDTATKEPLDCVLLLHSEKPPEVNYRTLFCYIAVQVSYRDALGSHPYPLYHVESKPCKQSKLPLNFCFHQPGTAYVIQLSVHSIVDSEGVEYMHHSEDCICVVQIIDRDQHGEVKMRNRHGVVMMKEPPPLRYTGPLATKRYHKLERQFAKLFLSPSYGEIQQLSKKVLTESEINPDFKAFALCWKALSEAIFQNYDHENCKELLKPAWEKATQLECENSLLLQGKVLRHLAHMYYAQGNDGKALEYISQAKERLYNAAPSNETAFTLHTDLRIKRRALFSIHAFSSELYTSIEKEYELLLEHEKYMEEHEKPVVCNFFVMKASFHLRSDMITDELPPKVHWPSPDDLRKAEECLNRVSLDTMPDKNNFYTARYYRTLCDLHIWKQQYHEAMHYLEKATEIHNKVKMEERMQKPVDQRCKLLERVIGEEKIIDEILKEYSNTDIV